MLKLFLMCFNTFAASKPVRWPALASYNLVFYRHFEF